MYFWEEHSSNTTKCLFSEVTHCCRCVTKPWVVQFDRCWCTVGRVWKCHVVCIFSERLVLGTQRNKSIKSCWRDLSSLGGSTPTALCFSHVRQKHSWPRSGYELECGLKNALGGKKPPQLSVLFILLPVSIQRLYLHSASDSLLTAADCPVHLTWHRVS